MMFLSALALTFFIASSNFQDSKSAFTKKVPYFEDKDTKVKWYWDDSGSRMATMKDPDDRNVVRISFDENVGEVLVGNSNCLVLTSNEDYLKIERAKDVECAIFKYRNDILKLDDKDIKSKEICIKKGDPKSVGYKLVRQGDCGNYKLFFEEVVELPSGIYVGTEDLPDGENGNTGGGDNSDNGGQGSEEEVDTSEEEVVTNKPTTKFTLPPSTAAPSTKHIEETTQGKGDIKLQATKQLTIQTNYDTTSTLTFSQEVSRAVSSSEYSSATSKASTETKTGTSTTGNNAKAPLSGNSATPTGASLTSKDSGNLAGAKETSTSISPTAVSVNNIITESSATYTAAGAAKPENGKNGIVKTESMKTTSSDSKSSGNSINTTPLRSTTEEREYPMTDHFMYTGIVSKFITKDVFIDECISKTTENIDDVDCYIKCLHRPTCKSFGYSSKHKCILHYCRVDKEKHRKKKSLDEIFVYYS